MSVTVDAKLVRRIAELAQLRLSDQEVAHYEVQLGKILKYVETISTIPSVNDGWRGDIEGDATPERNDVVVPSLDPTIAMSVAPQKIGTAFQVPRIIE